MLCFGRNDWTTFTTFKLHLHSFAIAHRRASARLSFVVKQLPRWFEPTTLVVQQKNPTTRVGLFYGRDERIDFRFTQSHWRSPAFS